MLRCLFRSKLHGDGIVSFDNLCAGYGDCLILVETQQGKRFGGYRKAAFHRGADSIDYDSFIFSLDSGYLAKASQASQHTQISDKKGLVVGFICAIKIKEGFTKTKESETWSYAEIEKNGIFRAEAKMGEEFLKERYISGKEHF